MKKTWLFIALSCVSIAANAAETNGIGYSHVELEYRDSNPRPAEYKGPGVNASIELGNGFFATGSYGHQKIDGFAGNSHVSTWSLGGGYAMELGKNLDWVNQADYVEHDASLTLGKLPNGHNVRTKEDLSGFRVSSGLRGRLTDNLLGHAYLGYQELGKVRNQLTEYRTKGGAFADLGLEYHFNDSWAATTGINVSGDFTEYTAGVRLSF